MSGATAPTSHTSLHFLPGDEYTRLPSSVICWFPKTHTTVYFHTRTIYGWNNYFSATASHCFTKSLHLKAITFHPLPLFLPCSFSNYIFLVPTLSPTLFLLLPHSHIHTHITAPQCRHTPLHHLPHSLPQPWPWRTDQSTKWRCLKVRAQWSVCQTGSSQFMKRQVLVLVSQ